ncbi:MAG TPA: hypothetical protein VMU51_10085 [Mycobacteriales bacterium]|nr:hypothetical protein [Mycobacteriales bacterium]
MAWISTPLSHLRRLGRHLGLARQRRLLLELDRRAAWATQARTAPTMSGRQR